MWIYLSDSFLSIVEDWNDESRLMVRGRALGDVEKVFPDAEVISTPTADYPFRAFIPREQVAQAIQAQVLGIHYTNFKASVSDGERHHRYMRCWTIMKYGGTK